MLRCQLLSHVLKALFFIKIAVKLSYFAKKCKIFERWVLRPQTPKTAPPPNCEFLATRLKKVGHVKNLQTLHLIWSNFPRKLFAEFNVLPRPTF